MIVMVVVVLAGVAVLGAVVVLAMGRGGELAPAHPDHPPPPLPDDRSVMGMEFAYLRLPRTLLGYEPTVTDEVFRRLAVELSNRDLRVAELEHQLDDLRHRLDERPETGEPGSVGGVL